MKLEIRADRSLIRAEGRSRRFVQVALESPPAPLRKDRSPVAIAFVIDRSGSMSGEKLDKARDAVVQGIRSLRTEDRFSVVGYDDRVELLHPSSLATAEAREEAVTRVRRLTARGSTDLCAGWLEGAAQVSEHLGPEAVGRVILLTDGLANVGVVDHGEIARRTTGLRERRVSTSTFGVGRDFDEGLLGRMADVGGGNFHFIEKAVQIPEFIAQEVGELLAITAHDVVVVLDADPRVEVASVNEFPCQKDGNSWRFSLGSLFAEQSIDPVLRLTFPRGVVGEHTRVTVTVEDRGGAFAEAKGELRFVWATHADNDAEARDVGVDRRVARIYADAAIRRAYELNREGDFRGATELIRRCAERVRGYAKSDEVLLALLDELERKHGEVSRDMDAIERKRGHYASRSSQKSRRGP